MSKSQEEYVESLMGTFTPKDHSKLNSIMEHIETAMDDLTMLFEETGCELLLEIQSKLITANVMRMSLLLYFSLQEAKKVRKLDGDEKAISEHLEKRILKHLNLDKS